MITLGADSSSMITSSSDMVDVLDSIENTTSVDAFDNILLVSPPSIDMQIVDDNTLVEGAYRGEDQYRVEEMTTNDTTLPSSSSSSSSSPTLNLQPQEESVPNSSSSFDSTILSDSKGHSSSCSSSTSNCIGKPFSVKASALPSFTAKVSQQNNDYDCGMYLLKFAEVYTKAPIREDNIISKTELEIYFKGDQWSSITQDAIERQRNDMLVDLRSMYK